jgi:HlyD family secretion protein
MKKWIIVIIAVVIIIALAMFLQHGVPVRAAEVKTGTISACIEERARTTLPRIYSMTMPLNGRILPITLIPGTIVKKGQTVAMMDDSSLRTLLVESEAKVEAIKGEINLNKYNAIEETALRESDSWNKIMHNAVEASWKKTEASKAEHEYAIWYKTSTEKMKQAISSKEAHRAKMIAAQSLVNHESDLITYNAIRTCEAVFKLLPVYIRQYLGRKDLNREILKQKLKEMQAALDQVNRDLKRTVITSPIDGIVLKRYTQNERILQAGEKLLDIGNLEQLEVTADVLSIYAGDIKPGNKVKIYGPAIGGKALDGKVIRVHPKGFTRISSLGVREQRVSVNIAINKDGLVDMRKQNRLLGVGFRVQVKIITAEKRNVPIIPATALFRDNSGNWRVFSIVSGRAVEKEVKIGIINDSEAEIISGLNTGDKVIIAPDTAIRNGTDVSMQ